MASPTETTAFVVALVALTISLFQVIQQYMGTSAVRNKVGRAAIGVWYKKNRRVWNFSEWKVALEYLQPTVTWDAVENCLDEQENEEHRILALFRGKYQASEAQRLVVRPQGMQFVENPRLRLQRVESNPEKGSPEVAAASLTWIERFASRRYERLLSWRNAPRQHPVTATWMNLLAALVGNPLDLTNHTSSSYFDADSIPSSSDNPLMFMHLSDLVAFGVMLDMEIVGRCDLQRPAIHMRGQFCSIMTQEESGIGVVGRYHSTPSHVHNMQTCTPSELRALVRLAQGYMHIGDCGAHMRDWGYNSANALFGIVTARETPEDWFQMSVKPTFRTQCEGDTDSQWGGRWSHPPPATHRVPFLLTICGNPAVATSFPHSLLEEWPEIERSPAAQTAYGLISQGVGFIEPTPGFCTRLNAQHIVRNEYKLASNWGAEHGGVRGWAITSSAEFVRRVSTCWPVNAQSNQVPILAEVRGLLETGNLSTAWGRAYNSTVKRFAGENKPWKPYAGTLCWIQCMMLDTWIARHVDLLMQGITDEASIPVDAATANKYAFLAVQGPMTKGTTTGWKRPRALFIRHYLARLADGIVDNQGTRVGASCMSPGSGSGAAGWTGMAIGNADNWAALDAVLTLRAILMATRLELMYNTDVFLELQQFDPMIRMA
ncbi:hypothetical protein C8F04DRAFT_1403328 [Mycena alexandri]|uniref:Uncharacterized protein n=1 Tax=Mycena alexandri TaxID=1745969 RepID=A0AAD6S611_9AGAR|nr:hypothetical protein C8F04DRAFT_1403328 [Mycena alexandri]